MKKILMVAAILALGFTSANAQYDQRHDRRDDRYDSEYNYPQQPGGRDSEINYLQREARQRIDNAIRRRDLSPREADLLMHDYRRIEAMERKFSHRGRLSSRETRILKNELERLMAETRKMSRGNDHWARWRNRY